MVKASQVPNLYPTESPLISSERENKPPLAGKSSNINDLANGLFA